MGEISPYGFSWVRCGLSARSIRGASDFSPRNDFPKAAVSSSSLHRWGARMMWRQPQDHLQPRSQHQRRHERLRLTHRFSRARGTVNVSPPTNEFTGPIQTDFSRFGHRVAASMAGHQATRFRSARAMPLFSLAIGRLREQGGGSIRTLPLRRTPSSSNLGGPSPSRSCLP